MTVEEGASCKACGTEVFDESIYDVTFEEACKAYGSRKWWISFFVRPCCPPPGGAQASRAIQRQRDMVLAREDFTDGQKAELVRLIDEGEAWYRSTPYWHKGEERS